MTPTVSRPPDKESVEDDAAPAAAVAPARSILASAFSSLQYRDFRLLWIGGGVSNIGTIMQTYAVQYLVFDMTHSTAWLGFDAFATWIPMNLLLPFGGVLADRLDRRRLLMVSNLVLGIIACVLGLLYWNGHLHVIHLIIASTINGAISGLVGPASMSMMPYLVSRSELPNAIALDSMQYNLSKAIGPAIGGVALTLGATLCFGLNAVSFGAVILAAALIHWRPEPVTKAHDSMVGGIAGGLAYFRSRPDLLLIQLLVIATSFAVSPMMTMLPAYVDVYGLGSKGAAAALAKMMSSFGVGAVVGTFFNAHKHGAPSPWIAFPLLALMSVVLGVLSFRPPFPVAMVLAMACGFLFLISVNRTFAAVLASTPPVFRGRITSIQFLAFGIGLPVGSLVAGFIAQRCGILAVFLAYGIGTIFAVTVLFWYLRSRKVKFQADGHLVEPEEFAQATQEGGV